MNKKFLSAILFGALALASTGSFVSCKDYDDDIKNLQTQINGLVTADALQQKVTDLTGQINNAKAAADEAKNIANKAVSAEQLAKELADLAKKTDIAEIKNLAEAAATKEDVKKAVDALEAKIEDLSKTATDLQNAIAKAAKQEDLTALATKVDSLENAVKAIKAAEAMVTSVSLIDAYSVTNRQGKKIVDGDTKDLGFKSVTEQDTKFGPKGEMEFDATKSHSIQKSEVIVRVSPTNAVITKDDVKLVNSKGENLDDLLKVVDVKQYDKLITKAANGLWVVTIETKENVTMKALEEATTTKDGKICYAVAIGDEARSVISTYDLTATPDKFEATSVLDFWVKNNDADWKNISEIHNRYTQSEDGKANDCKDNEEMVWKAAPSATDKYVVPAIAKNIVKKDDTSKNLYKNVKLKADGTTDDRQNQKLLAVELNKAIDININWNKDENEFTDIAGFYVALDTINAVESTPSEWKAWKEYKIEGLNKVNEKNSGSITITDEDAYGDIIGFRVYAVNLDGTLLDPDGRAFYVYVGTPSEIGTVPTQTIKAVKQTNSSTDADFLADFKKAMADVKGSYTAEGWTNTKRPICKDKTGDDLHSLNPEKRVFKVLVTNDVDEFELTNENIMTLDLSKVKAVKYVMPDAQDFVDDETYEQEMKIFKTVGEGDNATTVLVKTITVSFTKVMPTDKPGVDYITGQTKELLLAPKPNPTTLAEFGQKQNPEVAAINLNNIYYELSRTTEGTIKFVADNSLKDGNKGYVKNVEGLNAKEAGTNLVIKADAGAEKFAAITDGSEHTIKFYGFYKNVSLQYDPSKDSPMIKGDCVTKESTDFDVTYNCWHHFVKASYNDVKDVIEVGGDVVAGGFQPNLQWTTAGHPVIWFANCIKFESTKNPEIFNTTFGKYVEDGVIDAANGKFELVDVLKPTQKNNYFTPSWSAEKKGFLFEKSQNSSNPSGPVEQKLVVKVKDVFGHEISLDLGVVTILPATAGN